MSTRSRTDVQWLYTIGQLMTAPKITVRDQPTRELINNRTKINMSTPVLGILARKLNYKFMFAEAYWILSGSNKLSEIAPWMNRIRDFSDDGETLSGAYGIPFREQVFHVIESLRNDPFSRQAVMTFWRPYPKPSKDIPCTVSLQFLIRDKKLHCIVGMRSSDIFLGWPYDVFCFTMISMWVLLTLKVEYSLGDLYINAGSQHLYERDVEKAEHCLDNQICRKLFTLNETHFSSPSDLMEWLCVGRNDPERQLK